MRVFQACDQEAADDNADIGEFCLYVHMVILYESSLIDDFARGGVWLFQPVAVSPLRALGYGEPGDSWWCWENVRISWYIGKHWWERGIAL